MQTDIIVNMTWAVLLLTGAGILAFVGKNALRQIKAFIFELVPYLRRIFDKNSLLLAALASRGINVNQEQADEVAEVIANVLEKWASVQTPPPQEVNLAPIDTNDSIDAQKYKIGPS